mmetsp:Transcript_9454/g.23551  ORF Transcript_9454/g.23551 Transcript_9454/m.23551 type:complete len:226 (+) Transcript_9454:2100-2777(+)
MELFVGLAVPKDNVVRAGAFDDFFALPCFDHGPRLEQTFPVLCFDGSRLGPWYVLDRDAESEEMIFHFHLCISNIKFMPDQPRGDRPRGVQRPEIFSQQSVCHRVGYVMMPSYDPCWNSMSEFAKGEFVNGEYAFLDPEIHPSGIGQPHDSLLLTFHRIPTGNIQDIKEAFHHCVVAHFIRVRRIIRVDNKPSSTSITKWQQLDVSLPEMFDFPLGKVFLDHQSP